MVHARRKFFGLHEANKSQLAVQALHAIAGPYKVERQVRDISDEELGRIRQELVSPSSTHCITRCWPSVMWCPGR